MSLDNFGAISPGKRSQGNKVKKTIIMEISGKEKTAKKLTKVFEHLGSLSVLL